MKIFNSIILVFSFLLIGCGSNKDENTMVKSETERKAESEASEKQQTKILKPHMKTLNDAKSIEKKLQDAEAARKKKMEDQEENPD